jgi:mannose-6-phosphate isomerase-like protein (cupin superfamily)
MFVADIKKLTKENPYFRKVLHTGRFSQIVAMNIPIGGDIGEEIHQNIDQILFIVDGDAEAILNGETRNIEEHDVVFVPAGTTHNFKNIGDEELKLFTVYAPPEHPDGTVHETKGDAEEEEYR